MTRRFRSSSNALTAAAIILLGVLATLLLSAWMDRQRDQQAAQRFESQASNSAAVAMYRLSTFANTLRGLAAMHEAAPSGMGDLVEQLALDRHYPGLRGLAFVGRDLSSFGRTWNFSDRSQLSKGMFQRESVSRTFQLAADNQTVQVSPPVELESSGGENQPGFLMVFPLDETLEQTGDRYVFAVFDAARFFSPAFSAWPSLAAIEIRDVNGRTYYGGSPLNEDYETAVIPISAVGQDWRLAFAAPLGFFSGKGSIGFLISMLGISLSALLGFIYWRQGYARERAERLVEELQRSDDALRTNAGMLAANEERYRSLFEFNPDAVFSLTPEGRFESVNGAAQKLAGYPSEKLLGMRFQELIVKAEFSQTVERFLLSLNGAPQDFETAILHSNGRPIVIHVKAVPIVVGGKITGVYGIARDITDSKRFDAALKLLSEASAKLTETLESDALIQGLFALLIPAYVSDAGICLLEGGVKNSYATNDRLKSAIESLPIGVETKTYRRGELDGYGLGRFSVLDQPIMPGSAALGRFLLVKDSPFDELDKAVAADLAYRIASALDNAHLYQAASLAVQARDEFLSIASHELKTPLTSLLLRLEMLREQLRGAEKAKPEDLDAGLDAMFAQVDRLSKLIHEMLSITRLTSGKLSLQTEPVELGEFVSRVIAPYRKKPKEAGIDIELTTERVVGQVDPKRLSQAVDHLVTNALKFGEGKPVSVAVYADETVAHISVCDHGPGISEADVQRIFGRFEKAVDIRRHSSGLGMGLYITRKIVEAHAGTIDVLSRPEEGATFIVHLPLVASHNALV